MKRINILIFVLVFAFFSSNTYAQYTISPKKDVDSKMGSATNISIGNIETKANTPAYDRYLRKQKWHNRNFLSSNNSIFITQYSFKNWAAGGENSFNGRITSLTQHVYQRDKYVIATYFNGSYGLGQNNNKIVKIDGILQLNSDIGYVLYNRWSYTFGVNLASQFSKTYDNPETKGIYNSTFFAPANVKPYLGLTYKISDDQKITLAPVSGDILLVLNDSLSKAGALGVTPGKKSKLSMGAYLNCQWNMNITKDGMIKYKTIYQMFWDYKNAPNLNWENWIDITVFKLFSVKLSFRTIYDDKIDVQYTNSDGELVTSKSHWQFRQTLEFGISYNFINKEKPKYTIVR